MDSGAARTTAAFSQIELILAPIPDGGGGALSLALMCPDAHTLT